MTSSRATERAALPLILDGLTKRGFRMVTVSELLAEAPKAAAEGKAGRKAPVAD